MSTQKKVDDLHRHRVEKLSGHRRGEPTLCRANVDVVRQRVGTTPTPGVDRSKTHFIPVASLLPSQCLRLSGVDVDHVVKLAEALPDLPPIVVDRATMRVIDGTHRLRAAQLGGQSTIAAHYFDGDERSAYLLAVQSNTRHGLPLSRADRRTAAEQLIRLYPQYSDRSLARLSGLSAKTIGTIRTRSRLDEPGDSRVGTDGRVRPTNSEERRRTAMAYIATHPKATIREIAAAAGISVSTAQAVRKLALDPDGATPGANRGQRSGARREVERADPLRLSMSVAETLARDPALRGTDAGRVLIQWVQLNIRVHRDPHEFIAGLPPHCVKLMPKVTRAMAEMLNHFVDYLDEVEKAEENPRSDSWLAG
ncbi:ParB/RepB/Spo0J family partition protein [Saccharothrix obliqua]|uniref:ParB/RepB/Spo0J family partition protein n=1 Tax=Saccharothrix obliqua TaxID=2861747 RepID=UPI001C5CE459|nr:ParB N-terminal domain-containing protein [Saccharothrix obliqua]MBW4722340.1 ParB N-terminal domain-containing protein [Saccharothrix obliqua]